MVIDSRQCRSAIRRRRKCLACGSRFTTYEHRESPEALLDMQDAVLVEYERLGALVGQIAIRLKAVGRKRKPDE